MNFVLFHIGSKLPDHLIYCILQIKNINPEKKIYLITDAKTDIPDHVEHIHISNLKIPDIGTYYLYDPMGVLFRNAMLRIFYLEAFMKKYNVENVIHFDNDVLVYYDIDMIKEQLQQHDFYITPHHETQYVFGFSYIKNYKILEIVNNHLLKLVQIDINVLRRMVNHMPLVMRFLNYVYQINSNNLINVLPVLPDGNGSCDFDKFNFCFDPASYGQIMGSMNPVEYPDYYIAKRIIGKSVVIKFENKKPFVVSNNVKYPIFNLHIHNKKLQEYIS